MDVITRPRSTITGPDRSVKNSKLARLRANTGHWLAERLAARRGLTPGRLVATVAALFLLAISVSALHWRDSHEEIAGGKVSLSGVFERYSKEARRIVKEGGVLFPTETPDPGNARMLAHPPGYSILLAGLYSLGFDIERSVWFVQIVGFGVATVLVFLIASELFGWGAGLTSGTTVALSPHLAYYSLFLTPDSISVLPVLCAILVLIKNLERQQLMGMAVAGSLIGLSCWLTSNGMLLAPFLGVVLFFVLQTRRRLIAAGVLVGSMMIVIAPITIRNAIVFHRFVPISIQAGLSLVEGLGDYDPDRRFGMPHSDREARQKDVEWNGRDDYARSLWYPDGIDRDNVRFRRGMSLIRSNPGWFLRICARRAAFMLSYNDSKAHEYPFNTSQVARISTDLPYSHALASADNSPAAASTVLVLNQSIIPGKLAVDDSSRPAVSFSPAELQASGFLISEATVTLVDGGKALQVSGNNSEYGDQFSSPNIDVSKNTDYAMSLRVSLLNADMAIKITSVDRNRILAITSVAEAQNEASPTGQESAAASHPTAVIQMPFSSGAQTAVRVVVSNNAASPTPPALQLGQLELFEIGPTSYAWTRYPRALIAGVQRVYGTLLMRTLIGVGIVLLLLARRVRPTLILLAVPLYYVLAQAPLHTEFRYILAIHYFLFVFAAVTVFCLGLTATNIARTITGWIGHKLQTH